MRERKGGADMEMDTGVMALQGSKPITCTLFIALCCVRNPLHSFDSFFTMNTTWCPCTQSEFVKILKDFLHGKTMLIVADIKVIFNDWRFILQYCKYISLHLNTIQISKFCLDCFLKMLCGVNWPWKSYSKANFNTWEGIFPGKKKILPLATKGSPEWWEFVVCTFWCFFGFQDWLFQDLALDWNFFIIFTFWMSSPLEPSCRWLDIGRRCYPFMKSRSGTKRFLSTRPTHISLWTSQGHFIKRLWC